MGEVEFLPSGPADGCTTASVDTFSFQAPEFYPLHGYGDQILDVRYPPRYGGDDSVGLALMP